MISIESIFRFLTLAWVSRLYTGAEIALGALAAAGAGLQYTAASQARSNANKQMDATLASNREKTGQMAQLLTTRPQEIFNPQTTIQQREAQDTALNSDLSQFLSQVRQGSGVGSSGTQSTDFLKATADNATEQAQQAANLNRLWARLHAPSQVDLTKSLQTSRLMGDLNDINSDRQSAQAWGQMATQSAGQPDAGMMLGGQLLSTGATTLLGQKLANPTAGKAPVVDKSIYH